MTFREGFTAYRFDPNSLHRTGLNSGMEREFLEMVGQYGTIESQPGGRMLIWVEGEVDEVLPILDAMREKFPQQVK